MVPWPDRAGRPESVPAQPIAEDVIDEGLAANLRQELLDDNPLIVVNDRAPRIEPHIAGQVVRPPVVDRPVVCQQEGGLQAGDDEVLVVARISDDRGLLLCRGRSSNRPPLSIRNLARSEEL